MKFLKTLLFIGITLTFFSGCNSNNNNQEGGETPTTTQFYSDVVQVLGQNENDEPLEIDDTEDETSNFNSLL